MPAAGYHAGNKYYSEGTSCYYWTRSVYRRDCSYAYRLWAHEQSNTSSFDFAFRYCGCVIRAIRLPEPTFEDHPYVDLGLPSGTLWATMNVGASNPEDYGDFFPWGDIVYDRNATYIWTKDDGSSTGYNSGLTKYCTNKDYG